MGKERRKHLLRSSQSSQDPWWRGWRLLWAPKPTALGRETAFTAG